jgi:ABC-type multidrug transport system permease subunit
MMMQEKHLKSIFTFKKTAIFGSCLGIILILAGQFANGYNTTYFLTALGFGILAGSVVNYLFGTFLSLMEEFTSNRKIEPKMATHSRNYYLIK